MALDIRNDVPNDFDFIIGTWRVKHRRLKTRLSQCTEWIEFEGRSSTEKVLGGFGNLEDNCLYYPEGELRAVALRSYDRVQKNWSIWWLDERFPKDLGTPVVGGFKDGQGLFFADDTLNGQPIKVRFIWRSIDRDNARWEQAFSPDAGKTWETNWTMDFQRAKDTT